MRGWHWGHMKILCRGSVPKQRQYNIGKVSEDERHRSLVNETNALI